MDHGFTSSDSVAVQEPEIETHLSEIAWYAGPAAFCFMDHAVLEIGPVQDGGFADMDFFILAREGFFAEEYAEADEIIFHFRADTVAEEPQFPVADVEVFEFLSGEFHDVFFSLFYKISAERA